MVMALTMTNTLVLLLTGGHYVHVKQLSELGHEEIIFSALLVVTIFRFYHGNVRHLDSVYCGEPEGLHMIKPAPRGGLGVDFFVVLAQSVLFGVMSFYASDPPQLLVLFIILLGSDVAWALAVQQPTENNTIFDHQRNWLLNNFLAMAAMVAIYGIGKNAQHSDLLIYGGAAVMVLNATFDFAINWSFYFPSQNSGDSIVFLAAPLTQMLDSETGLLPSEYRSWLETMIRTLEQAGHRVISAHEREGWGEHLDSPTTALKADLEDLRRSSAVVAHVGDPASPGVQFELGVATSLGLPVVLLLEKGQDRPYLNPALPAVNSTEILEVDPQDGCHDRVVHALSNLLAQRA